MKKNYLTFVLMLSGVFGAYDASAWNKVGLDVKNKFGGGMMTTCDEHDSGDVLCIGETKDKCDAYQVDNGKGYLNTGLKDAGVPKAAGASKCSSTATEYASLHLLAYESSVGGVRICPTQVESRRKGTGRSWTEYRQVGGDSACFWACLPGYGGSECKEKVDPADSSMYVDTSTVSEADFASLNATTSGPNVEQSVLMFETNEGVKCKSKSWKAEHDMVLSVTDFDNSGKGVYVRPTVVRANRVGGGTCTSTSWPELYKAEDSDRVLLCLPGYQPETRLKGLVKKCVPINEAAASTASGLPWCSGFTEEKYSAARHKRVLSDDGTCVSFRCKAADQGFVSETDLNCVKCSSDMHGGVSAKTGVCVKCLTGSMFKDGECIESDVLKKEDLMSEKNKDGVKLDVKEQCWAMTTNMDYVGCMVKYKNVVKPTVEYEVPASKSSSSSGSSSSSTSVSASGVEDILGARKLPITSATVVSTLGNYAVKATQ